MRSTFTRMVIPIYFGIAFGLFIGCSTVSSSEKQGSGDHSLSKKELEAELAKVNRLLAESEEQASPEIYYQKGYVLSELAQKEEKASARSPIYQEMHGTLKKAEQMFDRSDLPEGKQKVDELLKVRWSHEHNQGVQIIQTDGALESGDYERAATHFKNATIILPDSIISYKLKAQAHYRNRQPEKAILTLEDAGQHISPLPSLILEQLAFLYLETDQAEKAVETYEDAESFSDNNPNLLHGLANAYISVENHQKAIELLDMLVEAEPENIIYAQTRGKELYFSAVAIIDDIISSSNPQGEVTDERIQEIDSLFNEAESQLKDVLSSNPDNSEVEQNLAFFYKNSAANYHRLIPYLSDDQAESVAQKVEDNLQSSIPLFVSLTQKNPEEKVLWKNLYQAYAFLGMDQKAEEVESKVNR